MPHNFTLCQVLEVKDTPREPVNSMIYTKKVTHVWPSTDFPKRTSKTQVLQETCFSGTLKTQRQNAFVFKWGRSNVICKPKTRIQNVQNARNNSDCRQNAVRTHDPKRKFCRFSKREFCKTRFWVPERGSKHTKIPILSYRGAFSKTKANKK